MCWGWVSDEGKRALLRWTGEPCLHRVQVVVPSLWAPTVQARLRAVCAGLSAEQESEEGRTFADFSDAAWADTPE